MINFRYHLVSLTAMFLALGLGIAMGATVVDRALVSGLEDQLNRVGTRADSVAANNDHLDDQLSSWERFAEQAGDEFVAGRLAGVPVVVVTFAGVDGDVVARVEAALRNAGAILPARVLFTSRFALPDESSTAELGALVAAGSGVAEQVRPEAARRVAEAWAGRARPELEAELVAADFLEITVDGGAAVPVIADLGARFLVVSSGQADVPNPALSVPLVRAMSDLAMPVVAADITRADRDSLRQPEQDVDPDPFVGPLRADERVLGRISTVDHAAGFRGRTAVVFALAELGEATVGQYGTGGGAERFLPD
ncbi:MAG TPA: copper transporter [Acidimicrobiales bacterium]|nr:copper transporter [Acidimicrobiales bacterium]